MGRKKKAEEVQAFSLFRRARGGKPTKFYSVKFTLEGKQVLKSTGCHEKDAAEKWAADYVQKLRSQDTAAGLAETVARIRRGGKNVAIAKAFELFEEIPKRRTPAAKQLQQKRSVWLDFMSYLGDQHPKTKNMSDVTEEIAQGYINHLRTKGRHNKSIVIKPKHRKKSIQYTSAVTKLSPKTCNDYLQHLKQIFESLRSRAGLATNPFEKIPRLAKRQAERQSFTPEQLQLIGEKADEFLRPLFAIGLYTGLREGDVCTLKWSEVDLDARIIVRRMRKTGVTVRIPIMPALHTLLQELPQEAKYVLPAQAHMYESNPVGVTYRVKHFLSAKPADGGLGFKTVEKEDENSRGVSILDFHSLRHTFCWLASQHNIPLPVVQSIVGHLTPSMTEAYANHASDADKISAIQNMPDYLGIGTTLAEGAIDAGSVALVEQIRDIVTGMTAKTLVADKKRLMQLLDADAR